MKYLPVYVSFFLTLYYGLNACYTLMLIDVVDAHAANVVVIVVVAFVKKVVWKTYLQR